MDPKELADAVVRNNMGVGGIEFVVRGTLDGSGVRIDGTDQRLAVVGAPSSAEMPWFVLAAEGWQPDMTTLWRWRGQRAAPSLGLADGSDGR